LVGQILDLSLHGTGHVAPVQGGHFGPNFG